MSALTIDDLYALAADRLPRMAFDYYDSGADEEHTLRDNQDAWRRIRLRPKCLVDVSSCDLATTVLGTPVSMPVLVAPTAFQKLAHPDGECATARAAAAAGTVMTLSTLSTCLMEDVARENGEGGLPTVTGASAANAAAGIAVAATRARTVTGRRRKRREDRFAMETRPWVLGNMDTRENAADRITVTLAGADLCISTYRAAAH